MFELSPLLAYETGVHLGDGNLTYNKKWNLYRITYAGNSETDSEFFECVLPKLIFEVYGKRVRIYHPKGEKTVLVVLNSKEIARFKMDALGLPSGNKNQLKEFPRKLKEKYPADIVRGLADTDFCLYFKDRNKDGIAEIPIIEGCFSNEAFCSEISGILFRLGILHSTRKVVSHNKYVEHRIRVEGKGQFCRWMEKIGFWNPKHLAKADDYFGNFPAEF
ncbi:hypothetical protein COV61_04675 [Candidatus Micrarchaeota archaeon CG11_big_fil_rev_8_21_14_0_20_47_5]|nr:MAG: hypothetical protein AUJ17_05880 [Candidatus Micrarchaeota archaeon CG1_02_47_40]PIN82878.1 MAG: hypothetical protein COV61_04675 [Candidatus Micrarchaeota archaeon CG11_big_fil_rev_8_21_14_0_20_47_5]